MKKRKLKRRVPAKKGARKSSSAGKPYDVFIDASAKSLGLSIEKSWKPSIRANLDVTFTLAARVMEFPLPDEAEPAAIYRV